jgi:lipoate-protein ligase A
MYYIIDKSTDPQWNLAAEEYLLREFEKPVFRLWRNDNAIIIGEHQNALAEINIDFVRKNNIKVVRRLSGGGAVFHDLGNVNFTFIDNREQGEDTSAMFARFTRPVVEALRELGVEAYLEGRNDLLIDGKKFSGNAIAIYKNRILQHGTLLFSASMANLGEALANRPEKFTGKGVQSNRSRVTNISEHLPKPMAIEEFIDFMYNFVNNRAGGEYIRYEYSEADLAAIEKLKEKKYGTDEWNFGHSPHYSFSKVLKFPAGLLEVYLTVKRGVIEEAKIYGDYFFSRETNEIESLLEGCTHSRDAIEKRLGTVCLNDYFNNVSVDEFLSLFD